MRRAADQTLPDDLGAAAVEVRSTIHATGRRRDPQEQCPAPALGCLSKAAVPCPGAMLSLNDLALRIDGRPLLDRAPDLPGAPRASSPCLTLALENPEPRLWAELTSSIPRPDLGRCGRAPPALRASRGRFGAGRHTRAVGEDDDAKICWLSEHHHVPAEIR